MKKFIIISLFVLIQFSFKEGSDKTNVSKEYPTPIGIDNLLFYVQRTINSNTIVYELNEDKNGNINEKEPVKVYWIKYSENSKVENLTYIQNNFAYGIESKIIDKEKKIFSFHFVSYKKRELFLFRTPNSGKFRVYTSINNKMAELEKVHVQIEGGTFMLPNVKYVLLTAKIVGTGETIIEKIKP